jgi:RNA polymerase sigma-70 factor, ECF subfamily
LAHTAVNVGMSLHIAVAEPFELHYQRAYDRHWHDVFRFVLAWTNDWAAAEDLAQETYLRLWQHGAGLDWERPVLPWLLVAARRLATNRFHALRRSIVPRRAEPTFDEAIRARWLDVRSAMASLSPLERTALVLTAVEGWSYAEVAEALGTSDGALRAAVSRARDKLEVA